MPKAAHTVSPLPFITKPSCPFPIEGHLGTLIVYGHARFPEGAERPTRTSGGDFPMSATRVVTVPAAQVVWSGDNFAARYERFADVDCRAAKEDVRDTFATACLRFTCHTWEALPTLDDRMGLGLADLICDNGIPVAVEFEDQHIEDVGPITADFKAIFAGYATLGEWALVPAERVGWVSGRAKVEWHPPSSWTPPASELHRN